MRKYDSTKTRVCPLFNYINKENEKINTFFSIFDPNFKLTSKILECKYGCDEKKIPPSRELLIWCVNHIKELKKEEFEKLKNDSSDTARKRLDLYNGDKKLQQEAILLLKQKIIPERGWYIFEGYTHPDIYIETADSIFIGEAKRTEGKLTTNTKWLSERDQLIRHIDSVIDTNKKVYSFFIFENPQKYGDVLEKYEKEKKYYADSLPHRDSDTIRRIMKTYLGYTTWDEINKKFNNQIKYPDTV